MGRIFNLKDWNEARRKLSGINIDNGDLVVVSPIETKAVIKEFLSEELDLYADEDIINYKFKITTDINTRLNEFETRLESHISEKIDALSEKIISRIISRVIEEEVNKKVEEKLKKIKELL